MTHPHRQAEAENSQAAGLLILTGPSHSGKSSVVRELLKLVRPPAAALGVDQVLHDTLIRPPGPPWVEIPLAYDLLVAQLEVLLRRDWLVVVESTFTYVPEVGEPEMHLGQINRFLDTAERLGKTALVVALRPSRGEALRRAGKTGRLPTAIVDRTVALHDAAELPRRTLFVDADSAGPEQLARLVLGALTA